MRRLRILLGWVSVVGAPLGCAPEAVPVEDVAWAMNANELASIRYAGVGMLGAFQQAAEPGGPWPRHSLDRFEVVVDYGVPAMRVERVWSQGEFPPRGGGGQPIAGQRSDRQLVSGTHAWNENMSGEISPAPETVRDRLLRLWMTPHGVVRFAMENGGVFRGKEGLFVIDGQNVTVVFGDAGVVERVSFSVDHPALGDMVIEMLYSDYRQQSGFMFPHRIEETWDGSPVLDVTIHDVQPNFHTASFDVPAVVLEAPRLPTPAPPTETIATAQQVAEGIWYLAGGNPRSVAIEFHDHVVIIEGPIDDGRTAAVLDFVGTTMPGKPVRYVVNTHHHLDHSGGLRGYVARGIPILTHRANEPYYRKLFARPHTINPDLLARSPREPIIEVMADTHVLTDGVRTLELYHIQEHLHAPGYLMAYLPKERMLIYADSYNPPAGEDPRDPGRTLEYAVGLYENIVERRRLDVETLLPLHGRPIPFENLEIAIGRIPFDE